MAARSHAAYWDALLAATAAEADCAAILTEDSADGALLAGERAGRVARNRAGGDRRIATAFDRMALIHDTLIAFLAARAGCTVVTEDRDFAAFARLDRSLRVIFYDRVGPSPTSPAAGRSPRPR